MVCLTVRAHVFFFFKNICHTITSRFYSGLCATIYIKWCHLSQTSVCFSPTGDYNPNIYPHQFQKTQNAAARLVFKLGCWFTKAPPYFPPTHYALPIKGARPNLYKRVLRHWPDCCPLFLTFKKNSKDPALSRIPLNSMMMILISLIMLLIPACILLLSDLHRFE